MARKHEIHINNRLSGDKSKYSPSKIFRFKYVQNVNWIPQKFTEDLEIPLSDWKDKQPYIFPLLSEATGLNLQKGSTGEYVCKHPGKNRFIPSKIKPVKISSSLFWDSNMIPEYLRTDASKYVLVTGGSDSTQDHLAAFTQGKHPEIDNAFPKFMSKQVRSVTRRFRRTTVPTFSIPDFSESYLSLYKPETGAGGETGYYFGTTRSAYPNFNRVAKKIWDKCKRKAPVPNCLWVLGSRSKVSKMKRIGERLNSRVVMQEDKVLFALQKPFVKRVENWLFNDYNQPIQIGKSLTNHRSDSIYWLRKIYKNCIELDYSLYDSTVPRDKIIMAFSLVRALFPRSRHLDNLFCYFCANFLYKNTQTANGDVILLKRGTPSGSAFTTIINSFANCIIADNILKSYRPLGATKNDFVVNGDDTELYFDGDISVSEDKLIKFIKNKFDMNVKIEYVGPSISENPDKASKFLKLTSSIVGDDIVLSTPPSVLLKRLIRPQKDFTSVSQFINQVFEQGNNLVQHPDSIELLVRYILYETDSLGSIDIWMDNRSWLLNMINSTQRKIFYPNINEVDVASDFQAPYTSEKKVLYDSSIDNPIDMTYVNNWLKDNFDVSTKTSKSSRYDWLTRIVGERYTLNRMCDDFNPLTPYIRYIRYGIPINESWFIFNEYMKWDFWRLYKAENPFKDKTLGLRIAFVVMLYSVMLCFDVFLYTLCL